MAYDQPTVSDEPDNFLDYLLRCGLTAPGATTSPTAGRILARLLVVGAIEGGDDLISPYLVPVPGRDATFEVRTYHAGDLVPMEVRDGLRAAAALKIALRGARDSDNGIEVVSRDRSGVERCVLVRDSTGDFEFRFASSQTLTGLPASCAAACDAWSVLFASWREGAAPPPPVVEEPEIVEEAVWAPPEDDEPPAFGSRGWWNANPGAAGRPRPGPEEGLQERADGVVAAEADWVAMAVPEVPVPLPPAAADEKPDVVAPRAEAGGGDEAAAALRAVQDAIANIVVEVDLGQVEQLIRRVLDDDRREMVEPLARRLSARIAESLQLPDTRALVEAVVQVIPQPGDLAEAVASDIGALLSETILRRRPGEAGLGVDAAGLMAAIEKLHVRVDGLEDQFRKSAGMLQTMGKHLDAGDRRAAIAERVTTAVDQEMQRLAHRIDEQVSALAATAGGGSELSDGVARLTRKLRLSVAELDRTLLRLDQVVDQVGGDRVSRRPLPSAAPSEGPGPAGQVRPTARR